MSRLLDRPPFSARDDRAFLAEMNEITAFHHRHNETYRRIFPAWRAADGIADLPFLHVGLFKRLTMKTESPELRHGRVLLSSSTTGVASRVALDEKSSALQSRSSQAIFADFVGGPSRPLLVMDDASSLRRPGEMSARLAAAMSLKPFATEIAFLGGSPETPWTVKTDTLGAMLDRADAFLVYGLTWILWEGWNAERFPADLRDRLRRKAVVFLHSGGWKKMEERKVDRAAFEARLLQSVAPGSRVIDFYGLVEQVGLVYPLCDAGFRHVPVWADVLVRDPFSLASLEGKTGMLQLMNPLSWGAPYHNVLTEDLGRIVAGACPCGRAGKWFELAGRVPKAETRGCGNV